MFKTNIVAFQIHNNVFRTTFKHFSETDAQHKNEADTTTVRFDNNNRRKTVEINETKYKLKIYGPARLCVMVAWGGIDLVWHRKSHAATIL